ncbi:MAG: BspA family leucine-rich repeat surface protein, partial [Bacilli bacterium]|nr:BspA family leucine-rich repeat surface protein [Bacilli bacterium]
DTSNVTTMQWMFGKTNKLLSLDLSSFNTSKVTDMSNMFNGCYTRTLDLSNFDTSQVTNMAYTFSECRMLQNLNLNNFDTSNVTNMSYMFYYCYNLLSLDLRSFNTSKVTTMSHMFVCYNLQSLDISSFNTSKVTDMSYMFSSDALPSIDLSNFDTSNVTNMSNMFWFHYLPILDVSNFDTSNVTDMSNMFTVQSITTLDLSNFDTSKVTNMNAMFESCRKLQSLNISSFRTSNVTNMGSMFSACIDLTTIDLSHFDTSKVTTMNGMFYSCGSLTSLDLSNFDTSNVTNIRDIFNACTRLKNVNLGNFNTGKVIIANMMAFGCQYLSMTISISNPDIQTSGMFTYAATKDGAKIVINYTESTSSLVDEIIANREQSNLVKGIAIDNYTVTINGNSDVTPSSTKAFYGQEITLNPISKDYKIGSFKLNGTLIEGNKFMMPNANATITDIQLIEGMDIIIQDENSDIVPSPNKAFSGEEIILQSTSGTYEIQSFKMNGTLINGNKFIMPDTNVTISDIETIHRAIIESEHNPYPNKLNDKIYGERTFEGATSLNVVLEYQTENVNYDWIYLYDQNGKQYGKYGGSTKQTETIIIPGNYIKITFKSDGSINDFYGFKATITPIY